MASLLKLMTREQELIEIIDKFDETIAAKENELRVLKSQKRDEERSLNQTRVFIKDYFKKLEEV